MFKIFTSEQTPAPYWISLKTHWLAFVSFLFLIWTVFNLLERADFIKTGYANILPRLPDSPPLLWISQDKMNKAQIGGMSQVGVVRPWPF